MKEKLRLLFHDRLVSFLFAGREPDFRSLVIRSLSGVLPREGETFTLEAEKFPELEKALSSLRRLFQLGETPFPFTLFPENKAPPWPRPGRIYISPALRRELEPNTSAFEFMVQFQEKDGLVEVKTPSTVSPETLFAARDLLWVGKGEPCFYCDLPWHRTSACPALKERVPGEAFFSYLRLRLPDLGARVSEPIEAQKLDAPELNGLYARYFYLLPSFLWVLFYRTTEGIHFAQISIPKEVVGQGGNLQIGLECLLQGDLSEAEQRFLTLEEEDYRALLGLAQVGILEEDPEKARYYLDQLSLEGLPPLVQAVVLTWKGRLHEWKRDYTSAERNYALGRRADHSFHPAAFHRLKANILLGAETPHLESLRAYLGYPLLYGLSFLEPVFLPMASDLEKELLDLEERKQAEALSTLREAEDELHRVKGILSEEERAALEDRLRRLREEIYAGSFYRLEQVALQASELALELKGYTYRKIRELQNSLSEYYARYTRLRRYWHSYPYPGEARNWGYKLKEIGERLTRVEHRLGKDPVKDFPRIFKEFERLSRLLDEAEEEQKRLEARRIFRRQLEFFLKIFLLGETLLFILFFTLPSIVSSLLPQALPALPLNLSTFIWCSLGVLLLSVLLALTRR